MNIRQKLCLSVLLLVVAFVTMTGTIAYTFRSIHRETARVAEVNRAVRMVFELSLLGYEYQTYREERGAVQWRGIHRRLEQCLAAMVTDLVLSEEQDVLRRLRDNHTLIGILFETLAAREGLPEAIRLSGQSLLLRSNVMVADAHQLVDSSNHAAATRTETLLLVLIGSLVPLALACGFIFVANHRILSSLLALDAGATAIGNGHLTHTLRVTGQDEFAALSRTMNTMAAQLHTDITQREHVQAQGQQYAQELADINTELAYAAESLESQNRLLADARDQACQATRTKSAFLASMSHEIRTPMNAILGMAELLEETPLTLTQQDYVQRLTRAGAHLLTLINDILDLSKIEADQLELEQTPFDLDELLNTVAELMAVRAHARGLELLCSVAPDVPVHRLGDPHRLRQILVNLLSNAIKFTDTGEVVLRVTQEPAGPPPGWLRFSVRDTGIGIPAEKLATIFESFTQVDTSTTRQYGGTGLGLSISKKLVELMGGRVWANSHLGQGSTFHVTVPCALNPPPPAPVLMAPAVLTDMRVLVVDNNATNCLILREMLRGWGALVTEAYGAEDALHAWSAAAQAATPFHLALLDCQMPGQDGFALATQLNQTTSQPPATLIMLSSDTRPGDLARCQALGIATLLPKPITRFILFRTITEAFGQRAAVSPLQPQATPPPCAATDRSLAILVAEDNEDNQILIQLYLMQTAHHLTLAENGAVAVERFTSGHYDLVLMDIQMPIMDGYTAATLMRQWEQEHDCAPTLIVALTANALAEDIQQSLDAGCNSHLTKPIKKAALLAALADYAGSLVPTDAGGHHAPLAPA